MAKIPANAKTFVEGDGAGSLPYACPAHFVLLVVLTASVCRSAYTVPIVAARRQQRSFLFTAWVIALVSLLLLIVALGAVNHHAAVPLFCVVLLPVFLFGIVELEQRQSVVTSDIRCCGALNLERPLLFQRPPPPFQA